MSIRTTLGQVVVVLLVAATAALTGCAATVASVGCNEKDNLAGDNNEPVCINGLKWTKNINIDTPNSWCYGDDPANCAKYGRLYTWEAAKSACASMGDGWRLPTREDWNKFVGYVNGGNLMGMATAARRLRSKTGWNNSGDTDDYGFSALPGGNRDTNGSFDDAGFKGHWWSATESGASEAYYWTVGVNVSEGSYGGRSKSNGYSARCVTP